MKIRNWLHDSNIIFTLLQLVAIAATVGGTLLALSLGYVGVSLMIRGIADGAAETLVFSLIGLTSVALVSVLCYVAIVTFYRMCCRLKAGSAFTRENTRAMRRIALCGLGVALCLFATDALVLLTSLIMFDPAFHLVDVYLIGLGCIFLLVSLAAWALYLLLERATALQLESDLTI